MTPRFWRLVTGLVVVTLLMVACNGSADESATEVPSEPAASAPAESAAESEPATGGEPEIAEITVGVLPIVDVAPVYLAIEEGLFEDEGLTVSPEVMQGGAAAIPALQGGDLDIAFGAWPSFLIANQEGIELRAVADGVAAAAGFTEFLALPDSGYEGDPSALAGTTIALNTLGNLGELALRDTLVDAGLEYSDVTAVEIPFPEMGAALDGGSVDVVWSVEPGVTGNKANLGALTVIDSYIDDMEGFPVAGYFVTGEFAEQNPNTVASFTRAVEAAADMLNDDPDLRVEIVQTYTELPPELLENVSFPEYRGELDIAQLERVYEKMLEHEMIEEGLDIGALVLN
jgi:ABC-type nitrate/sulfonate/bicarbonate transport system substrate-binding protein